MLTLEGWQSQAPLDDNVDRCSCPYSPPRSSHRPASSQDQLSQGCLSTSSGYRLWDWNFQRVHRLTLLLTHTHMHIHMTITDMYTLLDINIFATFPISPAGCHAFRLCWDCLKYVLLCTGVFFVPLYYPLLGGLRWFFLTLIHLKLLSP